MKISSLLILVFLATLLISACEDVIQVNVTPATEQLAVDAFINNNSTRQTIRLNQTVPYFFEGDAPTVGGAKVTLKNRTTGREFVFEDTKAGGIYAWQPVGKESIGTTGNAFLLTVQYQNVTFTAESSLNRTTKVDSITYGFREKGFGEAKEGYYAEFYGRDLPGQKDFYWIRSYRNSRYQSRILTYATNGIGGTDNNNGSDGFPFIPPIRGGINFDRDPYQLGDTIRVEIWSINQETLDFFIQAESQINNGGLFARPPENVRSNLKNTNPTSKIKATGWFNTSVVLGLGVLVTEEK